MKSLILAPHVRQKIDARVDRLLDDIGRPEPPLQSEVVRDWLKIDLPKSPGPQRLNRYMTHIFKHLGARQAAQFSQRLKPEIDRQDEDMCLD